jgi:hypothetical protein
MSILDLASSSAHGLSFPIGLGSHEKEIPIDALHGFRALTLPRCKTPSGFTRRSAVLTKHMRSVAKSRLQDRKQSEELRGLRALRLTFNRRQLRFGDQVRIDFGRAPKEPRIHANQWTFAGSVLAAYRSVSSQGGIGSRRGIVGLGQTCRGLEVSSAVAQAHRAAQSVGLRECCVIPAQRDELTSIVVTRGFDCSPLPVNFEQLQPVVASHARYFVKGADGKWSSVCLEAYRAMDGRLGIPSRGVLECLGQSFEVAWLRKDSLVGSAQQFLTPLFVQKANASCMMTAIDRSVPDFSMERLVDMAKHVRYIFLSMAPDQCPANTRLRAEMCELVQPCENLFISPLPGCSIHMLHRIIVHAVKEQKLCGDAHASIVLHRNVHHQQELARAVRAMVNDDTFQYDEDTEPDPAWKQHLEGVLSLTTGLVPRAWCCTLKCQLRC